MFPKFVQVGLILFFGGWGRLGGGRGAYIRVNWVSYLGSVYLGGLINGGRINRIYGIQSF